MCTGNPTKDKDHVDSSKSNTNNINGNLKDNESTTEEFVSYASFQPPDGGYGWIVVLAAFFVQFFVLGTMNNFGILFTELLEEFKETKQATGKAPILLYLIVPFIILFYPGLVFIYYCFLFIIRYIFLSSILSSFTLPLSSYFILSNSNYFFICNPILLIPHH